MARPLIVVFDTDGTVVDSGPVVVSFLTRPRSDWFPALTRGLEKKQISLFEEGLRDALERSLRHGP